MKQTDLQHTKFNDNLHFTRDKTVNAVDVDIDHETIFMNMILC